jgi:2-keto-4-pentenoate hydratase/2-oxohepta-3-ene-1,7-dioic acid hydratase in catechol pathway
MRVINAEGRLALDIDGRAVDVERASRALFGPDPQGAYDKWDEFVAWAARAASFDGPRIEDVHLGPPVPRPRQVFAIGLNYGAHAAEGGHPTPERPMVFTKFPSAVTGPHATVELPPGSVDFEAELVVVVGHIAYRVPQSAAWNHVAGLTVGQDLSERELQIGPPAPTQYSLAKSYPGFAPIGPAVVTRDEFADADDLEIGCRLDGEQMQKARTGDLIFGVAALVAYLSGVLPLLPGDLIFTGTPSGVGYARRPRRLLHPGAELVTWVEGIGELRTGFVERPA